MYNINCSRMAKFLVSKVLHMNTFFIYANEVWLIYLVLTPCAVSKHYSLRFSLFVNTIQHIIFSISSNYH